MKKIIIVFAMVFLLVSTSFVSAVSFQQQKKSIEKISKTEMYNKIVTTLKNKLNVNSTILKIIVTIFVILYTAFIVVPVFILLFLYFIWHCVIGNFLKAVLEKIYLNRHPDVPPW